MLWCCDPIILDKLVGCHGSFHGFWINIMRSPCLQGSNYWHYWQLSEIFGTMNNLILKAVSSVGLLVFRYKRQVIISLAWKGSVRNLLVRNANGNTMSLWNTWKEHFWLNKARVSLNLFVLIKTNYSFDQNRTVF